jgi:hypothetical protein
MIRIVYVVFNVVYGLDLTCITLRINNVRKIDGLRSKLISSLKPVKVTDIAYYINYPFSVHYESAMSCITGLWSQAHKTFWIKIVHSFLAY